MPIFFYQSLNSNSSFNHGLSSSSFQPFTRDTHSNLSGGSSPWKYDMPVASGETPVEPHIPVHGPANLIPSASDDFIKNLDPEEEKKRKRQTKQEIEEKKKEKERKQKEKEKIFLGMIEGKAKKTHQYINREFGGSCDLFVYGEVDGSHSEWSGLKDSAGKLLKATEIERACNNFSLHARDLSMHKFLCGGDGWVAVKSHGVIAVFVHVPNKVAKKEESAIQFYSEIKNQVLRSNDGGIVDLVMGDTNQQEGLSIDTSFTERVLGRAFDREFRDAQKVMSLQPTDSHDRTFTGTNSNESKKYDVAMYNVETVNLGNMKYISQFSEFGGKAVAVTDHMGMAIQVSKLSAG